LAGLPSLNSFPGAPAAIFLDFSGNGTYLPYDEDGNNTSFNASEQSNITKAWEHMSTYFAPFNVNVTTVLPSVPMAWGLITNSVTGAGWSYVNVFPNSSSGAPRSFNPAGDARGRQSGIAHEIGHNFGLSTVPDTTARTGRSWAWTTRRTCTSGSWGTRAIRRARSRTTSP
jgi:hypothetical protein